MVWEQDFIGCERVRCEKSRVEEDMASAEDSKDMKQPEAGTGRMRY